jgi:Asp-tRNA(Asn)/Glu-tRNA(Gln) amidotransferase A subunit family amidase
VPNFLDGLGQSVEGLRIGLPQHFFAEAQDVSAEVVSAIDRAAEMLEKLGAVVEQITLPDYELFNACGRVIMYTEAFAIHEQDYQTRPLGFRSADVFANDAWCLRHCGRSSSGDAVASRTVASGQSAAQEV